MSKPTLKQRYPKEYRAWTGMCARCFNPKGKHYKNYGGRGIIVCDEWRLSFDAFFSHVGPAPSPKHQIDRFPNNDGDYEPGNVRWANSKEQARNKRNNSWYLVDGKHVMVESDAVEFLGKKPNSCIVNHPRVEMLESTYKRYDVLKHLHLDVESYKSEIGEYTNKIREATEQILVTESLIEEEKERLQRIVDKVAASNRRYEEAKAKRRAASA